MDFQQDLTNAIGEFDDIQREVQYQQAQTTLRRLIERLDLSDRERTGLEQELQSLSGLLQKLEQSVIHISAFGLVGRGKSSLLNALVGYPVFETGAIHGVTQQIESVPWEVSRETLTANTEPEQDVLRVSLGGLGNSQIELIDTPGIDEVGGEAREILAKRIAQQVDLILFIIAGDMTQVEYEALQQLRQASKPILLVLNKIDQYPETDRQAIYQKLQDDRLKDLISPDEIVMTAAAPLVVQAKKHADGSLMRQVNRGQPQVAKLKLKILEVLHREGKALVLLNTLLYADEINEQIVARKLQIRDRAADDALWTGVMAKAIAVALNPITALDLLGGAAVDVTLIVTLSRLYGIEMTQPGAINLLKTIALGMGGLTASDLLVSFGLSSLKGLLGGTTVATGGLALPSYVSVAITQAAVAGVATYAIGQVTKTYLAQGATWGPEGPKAVVNQVLDSLDEDSILNRIKGELRAKIMIGQDL
ncbi:MAG: GTP-binding protein [Cyanobacteria bacterium P01_D01_bin.6]